MTKRILIVDDDPDAVLLLATRLQSEGYETASASNGVEAILAMAQGVQPDLILLDVMMPGMNGYELVKKLKHESDVVKHVPIIVLSGRKSMEDYFDKWDIAAFLTKPFDNKELLELIRQTVGSDEKPESDLDEEDEEEVSASGRPESSKRVLVIAIEEYVIDRLKAYLEPRGCVVTGTSDDRKAMADAATIDPDVVFCQYVEDSSKVDAVSVQQKIAQARNGKPFVFVPICSRDLRTDASRALKTSGVIGYAKMEELLKEVDKYV